ncbi:hypothetical protein Goklo_016600 [Gossypium klotzschianum]|uniref:Uncharacterized protein n=1 Tax=Gossypium klotzschianum TaxID=34286 RepID=A0A7J8UF12_9ROSI|nr:hypothetical protein [Gossypium klotzschianum]
MVGRCALNHFGETAEEANLEAWATLGSVPADVARATSNHGLSYVGLSDVLEDVRLLLDQHLKIEFKWMSYVDPEIISCIPTRSVIQLGNVGREGAVDSTLARPEAVTNSSNFPKLNVEIIFLELQGKMFMQEHGFEPSIILCKEIWPLVQHYRWEHFSVPLGKPYQVEKQGSEEGEYSEDEEVEKEEDEMEQDSQEEKDED